jgi:hypothetical protein
MNYPTHDTDWAISYKGNWWRRKNRIALIVGKRKDGRYWARRGDEFLPGSFASASEAKGALEFDSIQSDKYDADDDLVE